MTVARKIKRSRKTIDKKIEKKLQNKLMLFDRLPDACLTCEKEFDNKDRDMVQSWNVVVREEEEVVRLYCPDCWQKAQQVVESYLQKKEQEEQK